jgi:hypothetical protein
MTSAATPGEAPASDAIDVRGEIRSVRLGDAVEMVTFILVAFAAASAAVLSFDEESVGVQYSCLGAAVVLSCVVASGTFVGRRCDAKAIAAGEYAARRHCRSLLRSRIEAGSSKQLWSVLGWAAFFAVAALVHLSSSHRTWDLPFATVYLVLAVGVPTGTIYRCFVVRPHAARRLAALGRPSDAEVDATARKILAIGERLDAIAYLHEEAGFTWIDAVSHVDQIATRDRDGPQ